MPFTVFGGRRMLLTSLTKTTVRHGGVNIIIWGNFLTKDTDLNEGKDEWSHVW